MKRHQNEQARAPAGSASVLQAVIGLPNQSQDDRGSEKQRKAHRRATGNRLHRPPRRPVLQKENSAKRGSGDRVAARAIRLRGGERHEPLASVRGTRALSTYMQLPLICV